MPVDELRHTLSDASAAVEALSRRLEGRLEPADERLFEHVRITLRRFEEVMDALIAYEQATGAIDAQPVDLRDVVSKAIETHRDDLRPEDDVALRDLPVVIGDQALLLALFRPLIENAIKYRHPERALRIEIRAEPADPSTWTIVVADTGVGIETSALDDIFDMFERRDPRRSPGQGLGLAAARRIAEAHGGAISAVPQEEGAAIHVRLPLRR